MIFRILNSRSFRAVLGAGLMAAPLLACSPVVDARGNLPTPERLAQVKPGVIKRDDVLALLGTPSTIAAFDEDTWYYISARTEAVAFFEPETVERTVVAIAFDKDGVVEKVQTYGLGDGRDVDLVGRETPTAGKDMTIIQQLLGNVGRFSSESATGRMPGGR